MEYYPIINGLLIHGGKNDITGQIFSDLWCLNLRNLNWIELNMKLSQGISLNVLERFNHNVTLHETKIYVFGGIHKNQYANSDVYFIEMGIFIVKYFKRSQKIIIKI